MKSSFFNFLLFPAPDSETPDGQLSGSPAARVLIVMAAGKSDAEIILDGFLKKILEALQPGLSREVLFLKVTKGKPYSFSRLSAQYSLHSALIFGITPKDLGLHFNLPLYQPVQAGGITFLLAHPLADIYEERQQGGKEKAGQLWKAMQAFLPKH